MLDYTLREHMTQKIKNPIHGLQILARYTAGIELLGTEVKSVKSGMGSLKGAKCVIRAGEAFLMGANIPASQTDGKKIYIADRSRKLLLNKKEIAELSVYEDRKDLTIVPLGIYDRSRRLKLDIAVAKRLKTKDKREILKKKESDRSINRALKQMPQ